MAGGAKTNAHPSPGYPVSTGQKRSHVATKAPGLILVGQLSDIEAGFSTTAVAIPAGA
jgi:hypothetical protein